MKPGRELAQTDKQKINELKIEKALQTIRDYYLSKVDKSYDDEISRKIDALTFLIES